MTIDGKQALKWYKLAADQGHAASEYAIGLLYFTGSPGISQNIPDAIEWYQRAAQRGLADAQNSLGVIYAEGHGVPVNLKEAVKWYTSAAEQGHAVSQANLATMYRYGQGVKQDNIRAYKWYAIAGAQFAMSNVGMKVASDISKQKIAQSMSPGDIAKAKKEADAWLEKNGVLVASDLN